MKRTELKRSTKILPRQTLSLKTRAPMRKSRPKSTPERRAAKGMPCLLNVANVCNYDEATVVLVHLPWLGGSGMGMKTTDLSACHACSSCHRWVDCPTPAETQNQLKYESEKNFYAARALVRMREVDREMAA